MPGWCEGYRGEVSARSSWGISPRESIERECSRRGRDEVVAGCVALLEGHAADPDLVHALGGPAAGWVLGAGSDDSGYWCRVWAARGLLWEWDDVALPAVVAALGDEVWRVREMALKVVARHRLEDALTDVAKMQDDPVQRVRAAARRALARLSGGEGAPSRLPR
jgi:HEAT repeat protein